MSIRLYTLFAFVALLPMVAMSQTHGIPEGEDVKSDYQELIPGKQDLELKRQIRKLLSEFRMNLSIITDGNTPDNVKDSLMLKTIELFPPSGVLQPYEEYRMDDDSDPDPIVPPPSFSVRTRIINTMNYSWEWKYEDVFEYLSRMRNGHEPVSLGIESVDFVIFDDAKISGIRVGTSYKYNVLTDCCTSNNRLFEYPFEWHDVHSISTIKIYIIDIVEYIDHI